MSYNELNDIYGWFQTGKTPTELQFQKTFSSFYHKSEQIPITAVTGLNALFQQTATLAALNAHINSSDPHTSVLAKKDASNVTDMEAGQWIEKLKLNQLYLAISDYILSGKIRADKIEALGLTELISVTETSLAAFMANNANYTYEKNDMIAIPDGSGNHSLYIYTGGEKVELSSYLPTGLTNITISMVQGLQSTLDSKLDKPSGTGFFLIGNGGSSQPFYAQINPTSYYLPFWNGSSFQASDIYVSPLNGRVGIGTGAANLQHKFEVAGSTKLTTLMISNPTNAQGDASFTKVFVGKSDGTVGWIDRADVISSGTTALNTSGFPDIFAYRNTISMKNSFVHIYLDLNLGDQSSSNWGIIGVIPSQFRPAQNTLIPGWLTYIINGSQTKKTALYMIESTTGNISMMEAIPGGTTGVSLTISTQFVKMN